jgi:hypothetical protein
VLARLTPSWSRWVPSMPQLAVGSMLAAAAVITLSLRAHRADDAAPSAPLAIARPIPQPAPPAAIDPAPIAPAPGDVTADLTAEPAQLTANYAQAIDELAKLADDARVNWSADHQAAFATRVASLRGEIAKADSPRGKQRAARTLIRYLQGAVVRDDVMLASGGVR